MFDRHLGVWPAHVPRRLMLPETSLYTNLEISALRYPHGRAIIYYGSELSYAELKRQVDALAGYLQQAGVGKGDRVLLYMQNSPQFVIGYYAILRANAVVVPASSLNRQVELDYLLEDTGARHVICAQEVYPYVASRIEQHSLHVVVAAYADYLTEPTDLHLPEVVAHPPEPVAAPAVRWKEALAAGAVAGPHMVGPEDLCVIPYSSGTTGKPKGCMHTHRSTMSTAVNSAVWSQIYNDAVQLVSIPLAHVTGMQSVMNGSVYAGCTMLMMTRWDRRLAAELIQRYRATTWRNVPPMVVDLLSDPNIDDYDLSSLKLVSGGGAAMPAAVEAKLFEKTGLHYLEGYGLTETMAGVHINPPHAPKPQCLGIPTIGVDSRVIDLDTGELLGPHRPGELVTRGPQVFRGYWNRPRETEEAFVEIDGERFFRTGDIAYYDEEGYFFLVDRVKRMINVAGFKVWPAEVESLLYAHPAIREACVIATPHPRRGEAVKAVVVRDEPGSTVTEAEISAWCRQRMAAYKCPKVIEFVEALPRSATGKIMWRVLQEREYSKG